MNRIGLVGASGFVGSAVADALQRRGVDVVPVSAPRLPDVDEPAATALLEGALNDCSAVINAAGISEATSGDEAALMGANAALPGLIAKVAAGRRFVQISSAAAQGRVEILDSDPQTSPVTPYARSKAEGERRVLSISGDIVVFRPPGVHAAQRRVTRSLHKIATSPISSVAGRGERPTAQAQLPNIADAVAFLATAPAGLPQIVHQPSEGLTTAELLRRLSGGQQPKHLPDLACRTAVRGLVRAPSAALRAQGRRLEMLWLGQGQAPSWLTSAGWTPPADLSGWDRMGEELTNAAETSRHTGS